MERKKIRLKLYLFFVSKVKLNTIKKINKCQFDHLSIPGWWPNTSTSRALRSIMWIPHLKLHKNSLRVDGHEYGHNL